MVHKAFELRPVKDVSGKVMDSLQQTVHALCTVGSDRLIIGTTSSLLGFQVSKGGEVLSPKDHHKLKARADQLIPFPELNWLVVLADGAIQQFDISASIVQKRDVAKVSSCTVLAAKKECRDGHRPRYFLVAGKKMKLFLLEFDEGERGFVVRSEYSLPDNPKSLSWNANGIFLGMKKEVSLLNISSDQVKIRDLFPASQVVSMPVTSEVHIIRTGSGHDGVGVSLNAEGAATRTGTGVEWRYVPHTLCYSYPYLIGLSDRHIEIRALSTLDGKDRRGDIFCQDISVSNPKLCSLSNYVDLQAAALQHEYMRGESVMGEQSTCNNGTEVHTPQPLVFISDAKNGLLVLTPVKYQTQVNELLQANKKEDFEAALILGKLLTVTDIPQPLVERTHALYGFHLFSKCDFANAMRQFRLSSIDPRVVISMFGMLPAYVAERWKPSEEHARCVAQARIPLAQEQEKYNACERLVSWLKVLREPPARGQPAEDTTKLDTTEKGMKQASIDTALLASLVISSEGDVAKFLEQPNRCVVTDSQAILARQGRWEDTVLLFRSKGRHKEALDLLKQLGNGERPWNKEANKVIGLKGTIDYIQRLDAKQQPQLITTYSPWVLQKANLSDALSMFYHDPKKMMNPNDVLAHLSKVLPGNLEARVQYLQKILHDPQFKEEQCCKDPSIHEALITASVQLIEGYRKNGDNVKAEEAGESIGKFLMASKYYKIDAAKSQFKSKEFYKQSAIVHCKQELHKEALKILVENGSLEECIEYCNRECLPPPEEDARPRKKTDKHKGAELRTELHFILFKLLLKTEPQRLDDALRILTEHADKVDRLKALSKLPGHIRMCDIAGWIVSTLKEVSVKRHEQKILKGLCKSENLQVGVQYAKLHSQKFTIESHTVCDKCKKKIGNSNIAYYPNKIMVHKGCDGGSATVCPVRNRKFSELDELCGIGDKQ